MKAQEGKQEIGRLGCSFGQCMPKRYIIVVLTCIGMCVIHAMRVNVAVTVVTILDKAPHMKVGTIKAIASLPDVMWDARMIGFLHSVFFIGYLITQVPGGYLATKLPAHRLFGGCIFISCSLNLVLPISITDVGYLMTCIIRGLQGFSEGVLYPSTYAILRHWTTPDERSRMGAIVLTGVYTGAVIGLPVSGLITHYFGWQYVYYAHGGIGIIWFLVWFCSAHETPASHPYISHEERNYIEKAQGLTAIILENDSVPWREIITSLPVHALNVCNFARNFVFFLLLTNEPAYLNVFGYNLAQNGALSSLPHLLMAVMAAVSGPIADCSMKNPLLTPTNVRKLFTCIGFGMEAFCLLMLSFISNGMIALLFLTMGVGASGLTVSGWQINHLDLAPRYASVLVGLSTACGTVAGIIVPLIVGHMTLHQTVASWQMVFLVTGFIVLAAALFYGIFGSGDPQKWAEPIPELQLVDKIDPMAKKPYQAVLAQEHMGASSLLIKPAKTAKEPVESVPKKDQEEKETQLNADDGADEQKGGSDSNRPVRKRTQGKDQSTYENIS